MHPFARPAPRLAVAFPKDARLSARVGLVQTRPITHWICATCGFDSERTRVGETGRVTYDVKGRRGFASTVLRKEQSRQASSGTLPSHVEGRRWQMSKDMTKFVDGILARASIAGQHINVYTGTDYSGIEALRKEITVQEQMVKDRHAEADEAKTVHREAYIKQASAQKEIVGLLERKSSWGPTDLERYMSLVRSEHVNDQAVQVAKDDLAAAERQLEDARSLLERLERKQYHEEQIWSDTIRRNSTWLTFGLMGVNIVLLLAQILIFEPYRRRKIVRDMKAALDEKTLHAPVHAPAGEVAKQVDEVVEPAGTPIEVVERTVMPERPLDAVLAAKAKTGTAPPTAGERLPEEATDIFHGPAELEELLSDEPSEVYRKDGVGQTYTEAFYDLFSERLVQIKQVELTTVALQGAATGVAAMGLLFLLLRPT